MATNAENNKKILFTAEQIAKLSTPICKCGSKLRSETERKLKTCGDCLKKLKWEKI